MEITTYSNFRQHMKKYLDAIRASNTPLFVTRSKGDDVVVMSMEDYEGMQETLHLLSSPNNAARINSALQSYNKGKGVERGLIQD